MIVNAPAVMVQLVVRGTLPLVDRLVHRTLPADRAVAALADWVVVALADRVVVAPAADEVASLKWTHRFSMAAWACCWSLAWRLQLF